MSQRTDYTREELDAVVAHFFPDGGVQLSATDLFELANSFGGQTALLRLHASMIGIQVGKSLHLPQLTRRLEQYLESRR